MSEKYIDVDTSVVKLFQQVLHDYCDPSYSNLKIKLVFDNKAGKKGGKFLFANIRATNPLIKHLSAADAGNPDGYDYIICITKKYWDSFTDADKIRILRHETRHIDIIYKDNGDIKCGIKDHEITDFYDDVDIESRSGGDVRWAERLAEIASQIEDKEAEEKAAAKAARMS